MSDPTLIVFNGLDGRDVTTHKLAPGDNLAKQIMEISPDRWGGNHVYLFRNNMHRDNLIELMDVPEITVRPDDFYVLRATPSGDFITTLVTAAAIGTIVALTGGAAIGLLAGGLTLLGYVAANALIPTPKLPQAETARDQASGLNSIGTPRNIARVGSRIPDTFGTLRMWPDIAAPAYEDWHGRTQRVEALYCLGIGHYRVSSFRLGETNISTLPGVKVTVYDPGSTIPAYPVVRDVESNRQITLEMDNWTPWITLVGDRIEEIWVDIGFPSGLVIYKSSGGKREEETSVIVEFQRVDIESSADQRTFKFTEKSGNPLRFTRKVTGLAKGSYRVRARRADEGTTSENDIHVSDNQLVRMAGVEYMPSAGRDTRTRTFVRLEIDNNDQVAQLSSYTFNCIVHRFLRRVYSNGDISEDRVETTRLIDALYYTLHDPKLGGFSTSLIDLPGLWELHEDLDALDGGQGAQFNGTFDRYTTVDEMCQAIATVGRASVVYDGGRITFLRDGPKETPVAVFNRRNRLADHPATKVLTFQVPDEEDGVEIEWLDRDNGYVSRVYTYPDSAINPRKINLIGATAWSQVYRRAVYEYRRGRYRRRTYQIGTTEEGTIVNPMDLISVVDVTYDNFIDGDVLEYNEGTRRLTLDKPVHVPSGEPFIRLRRVTGDLSADMELHSESIGETTDVVRLKENPPFDIVGRSSNRQVGTLFVIGTQSYLNKTLWLVLEVVLGDAGAVDLNLIEYNDNVYSGDTWELPNPPTLV